MKEHCYIPLKMSLKLEKKHLQWCLNIRAGKNVFLEFLLLGSYGSKTSGRKIHIVLFLNKLSKGIGDEIVRGLLKDKIINDNYLQRKTVDKKENCVKQKKQSYYYHLL